MTTVCFLIKFTYYKTYKVSHMDVMYNMVTIVANIVLYICFFKILFIF